jgi:hypothetical protein
MAEADAEADAGGAVFVFVFVLPVISALRGGNEPRRRADADPLPLLLPESTTVKAGDKVRVEFITAISGAAPVASVCSAAAAVASAERTASGESGVT